MTDHVIDVTSARLAHLDAIRTSTTPTLTDGRVVTVLDATHLTALLLGGRPVVELDRDELDALIDALTGARDEIERGDW